jgi:hypothetical protein
MHRTGRISPSLLVITSSSYFGHFPLISLSFPPLLLLSTPALRLFPWSFINLASFHNLLFRRASVRLPPADICVVSDYQFAPAPRADRFSPFYSFFSCARFLLLPPSFSPSLSSVASLICSYSVSCFPILPGPLLLKPTSRRIFIEPCFNARSLSLLLDASLRTGVAAPFIASILAH